MDLFQRRADEAACSDEPSHRRIAATRLASSILNRLRGQGAVTSCFLQNPQGKHGADSWFFSFAVGNSGSLEVRDIPCRALLTGSHPFLIKASRSLLWRYSFAPRLKFRLLDHDRAHHGKNTVFLIPWCCLFCDSPRPCRSLAAADPGASCPST